jgi:hypothetical protein
MIIIDNMSNFYRPLVFKIGDKPVILYPYLGIEAGFSRFERGGLEKYVSSIINNDAVYSVVILWQENQHIMSDVWLFGEFESWEAGPVVSVINYRNGEIETKGGVTAGDGLVMLGREEEQRRKSKNLEEYINGQRPELPDNLTPMEDFYL